MCIRWQSGLSCSLLALPEWRVSCSSHSPISLPASFRVSPSHVLGNNSFRTGIFSLVGLEQLCAQIVEIHRIEHFHSDAIFMTSRNSGFQALFRGSMTFQDLCMFCLFCCVLWSSCYSFLQLPKVHGCFHFTRDGCFHRIFHFFRFWWFLSIFQIDEVNASQCSSIAKLCICSLAHSCFSFFFRSFWHSCVNFRPRMILVWQLLQSSWVAPKTTCVLEEVCHVITQTLWILSMNLTSFDPRRRSNSHQFVVPATHPDLWMGLGMILLSAHRDGLEVRRDDDKWSLFPLTRSHHGLQRHHLFMSIEISPSFLQVLPWDLHSLLVDFALEWLLGFHDLFQTVLLIRLRLGICNVHLFLTLIVVLHQAPEHGFLTRPNFPAPRCLRPRHLLSKFLPRSTW